MVAPGVRDGRDLRDRARGLQPIAQTRGRAPTCARAPSTSTSTCSVRSTGDGGLRPLRPRGPRLHLGETDKAELARGLRARRAGNRQPSGSPGGLTRKTSTVPRTPLSSAAALPSISGAVAALADLLRGHDARAARESGEPRGQGSPRPYNHRPAGLHPGREPPRKQRRLVSRERSTRPSTASTTGAGSGTRASPRRRSSSQVGNGGSTVPRTARSKLRTTVPRSSSGVLADLVKPTMHETDSHGLRASPAAALGLVADHCLHLLAQAQVEHVPGRRTASGSRPRRGAARSMMSPVEERLAEDSAGDRDAAIERLIAAVSSRNDSRLSRRPAALLRAATARPPR